MVKCVYIDGRKRILCFGALRQNITFLERNIVADDSSVDFNEEFTEVWTTKAMVETTTGKDIFDGSNIIGSATHMIAVRYREFITSQTWIRFKNRYFNILQVENIDEDDEWLMLRCSERGDVTKKANWA